MTTPPRQGQAVCIDDATLRDEIRSAKEAITGAGRHFFGRPDPPSRLVTTRFSATLRDMILGRAMKAAASLDYFMHVPSNVSTPSLDDSIDEIIREVTTRGNDVTKECLNYVLYEAAGSSTEIFPNSPYPRDCDADGVRKDRQKESGEPMRFDDFVAHKDAVRASLHRAHVLALRLYTTAAFVEINDPLRDLNDERNRCRRPHPFPHTVRLIRDAIKQLRQNNDSIQSDRTSGRRTTLYRGLKDVQLTEDFLRNGGTDVGTMSTTSSLHVALEYAAATSPTLRTTHTLLQLQLRNGLQRGADISFLSAFPAEKEVVYPPLTLIQPEGEPREIEGITVIDAMVTVA